MINFRKYPYRVGETYGQDGQIHRHIGGLEIFDFLLNLNEQIHRHIGGLEILSSHR